MDERSGTPDYCAWAEADQHPVTVRLHPLPDCTGGGLYQPRPGWPTDLIVIDPDQPGTERTATLAHELEHHKRGGGANHPNMPPDWTPVDRRDEDSVDDAAARRLLPPAILEGWIRGQLALDQPIDPRTVAAEYGVTLDIACRALAGIAGRWIAVMNHDGTNIEFLTTPPAPLRDSGPVWSPDGDLIAFVRTDATDPQDHTSDIFTIAPDGTGEAQITSTPTVDELELDWSPDGSTIAYMRHDGSAAQRDIYGISPDGTNNRPLIATGMEDRQPSWSPDGTKIAFIDSNFGRPQIWTANADGTNTNVTRITSTGHCFDPAGNPRSTQRA